MTMSMRPVLAALLVASLVTTSAPARVGGIGGVVGGLGEPVGGLIGGLGGTVGQVSGPVGGIVGGPIGGLVGGLGGTVGQVGGTVDQTLSSLAMTQGPLGSLGGVPGTLGGVPGTLGSLTNPVLGVLNGSESPSASPVSLDRVSGPDLRAESPQSIARLRQDRLDALVRTYRSLERDPEGQPVQRGELIVTNPQPTALAAVLRAGFRVKADEQTPELGLRVLTLFTPKGMNARKAMKLIRQAAPGIEVDYNHVYEPAGGALLPAMSATLAAAPPVRAGTRIAMIDGGVASHPSLAQAGIEQRGFSGPPQPTGHGTAVGSLLVGNEGPFRGAARGAQLFVGDVYGGSPAAGSATAIVRALAWAASKQPAVINISLVGPDNRVLARAIAALRARGILLVAAVGNDGPAAPPQYPASYDGVIAVTGVDAADRALLEAGRATHLDFAAPGADLVAALPGKGYTPVRGTSFAAPFVAARLAATGSAARLAAEAVPGKGKVGRGIVCRNCRVTPKLVGLR